MGWFWVVVILEEFLGFVFGWAWMAWIWHGRDGDGHIIFVYIYERGVNERKIS